MTFPDQGSNMIKTSKKNAFAIFTIGKKLLPKPHHNNIRII
jgi:hypothetical protein